MVLIPARLLTHPIEDERPGMMVSYSKMNEKFTDQYTDLKARWTDDDETQQQNWSRTSWMESKTEAKVQTR